MLKKVYLLVAQQIFFCFFISAQINSATHNDELRNSNTMRIMFYNVENLFDTINDPHHNDEDFLPKGNYRWNSFRLYNKLQNTYKVITAVGGWETPEIIGFCEIENRYVLEQLIKRTPLKSSNYEIVHFDSPDDRGIDVGLIYRPDKFNPVEQKPLNVSLNNDTSFKTRDILYVKGIVFNSDTLHLFINHWPSRRGGETVSEPKRIEAAKTARKKIDEIIKTNAAANILLMGDFNDYPDNRSLHEVLRAKEDLKTTQEIDLVNLMFEKLKNHEGSHKYQSHWGCLDQIIISPIMLQSSNKLQIKNNKAFIYKNDFLLKDDERWMGKKPFRTYEGLKYKGGFSDHLPVYVDIILKN